MLYNSQKARIRQQHTLYFYSIVRGYKFSIPINWTPCAEGIKALLDFGSFVLTWGLKAIRIRNRVNTICQPHAENWIVVTTIINIHMHATFQNDKPS